MVVLVEARVIMEAMQVGILLTSLRTLRVLFSSLSAFPLPRASSFGPSTSELYKHNQ